MSNLTGQCFQRLSAGGDIQRFEPADRPAALVRTETLGDCEIAPDMSREGELTTAAIVHLR